MLKDKIPVLFDKLSGGVHAVYRKLIMIGVVITFLLFCIGIPFYTLHTYEQKNQILAFLIVYLVMFSLPAFVDSIMKKKRETVISIENMTGGILLVLLAGIIHFFSYDMYPVLFIMCLSILGVFIYKIGKHSK